MSGDGLTSLSGTLSGSPTATGTQRIVVEATDVYGNSASEEVVVETVAAPSTSSTAPKSTGAFGETSNTPIVTAPRIPDTNTTGTGRSPVVTSHSQWHETMRKERPSMMPHTGF